MSQAHIHLIITHLPIFGSILGALVLAHGIWAKSEQTKIAAYNLFIVAAIGAAIAYFTGEGAEESVEHLQGVSKNMIHQHEDFAMTALVALMVLGAASLVGLVASMKKWAISKTLAFVILLVALIGFGLAARTGYLGGQIRHTEIGTGAAGEQTLSGEGEKDD
jgi:uncharacterized membrane protein